MGGEVDTVRRVMVTMTVMVRRKGSDSEGNAPTSEVDGRSPMSK